LIEATDGAVNMTHEDGRVSRVGGISIDPGRALPADRWADLTHPDDRIETDSKWAQAIASRTAQRFEHRLRQPDGSFRWSRTVAAPVKNQHGAVVEWIGVTSDVDLEMNYAPDLTRSNRLTGTQIRAARGILGWSVKDLADKAQISPNTVRRYEEVNGAPDTDENALMKIRSACESAKIEFIFPHAGKPGVRLR
jgi:DNA-binding transcriptional regulator YiaG